MKRRVLALLLTAAMLLGMTPVSAVEAEGTVITGFAALEQDVMEAETGTAREDLGLPETVTATVLETVTTLTGNGEGEAPTVTTEEVETEREISVEWSTPLFGGYDPDQAGEYTFTAGARGYVLAEGVEWPTITVTLTEPEPELEAEAEAETEPAPEAAPEAAPETEPEVQAVPVITGFNLDGETSYEVAAGEEMTAEIIAAGLTEDVAVTAAVDGEDVVLPVDWSCPDFDGQTNGTYTFTAYAQGYALAEGAAWPTVTVEVAGAEPLLTATVTTWTDLSYYSMTAFDTTNTLTISGTLSANSTITIASGRNITISGGTITRASGFTGGDLFSVSSGGTLTLKNVTINGNNVTTTQSAVEVASGGKFTAQGCTFQNNKITTGGYYGAAINNAGTATISGCTLQNNTVSSVGSAVYSTGTLTINQNGSTYTTISGNTCTTSQGAVAVLDGTASISYTKIQNNTASYGGPALYVSSGTVTIGANTTISGNKATTTNRPGAIWVSGGTVKMTGGSIQSNSSAYGVWVSDNGVFNMTGGTISGNSKGGVYYRGGTFNMSGGSIINNTDYGITVSSGLSPSLSGAVTVTGNTSGNVYLPNASTKVTLAGAVTGSVGVTQSGAAKGGTFATASSTSIANNSAGKFFHDPGTYSVTASATSLVWGDTVASVTKADGTVTKYTTLQAAVNAAGTGDTVTLLADTSETVTITTSFDTLDWTGHTLTTDGKLDISGAVNTIQNTVDGQQNYANGGVSFTATNQYVNIVGTVGEIKGGCYSGTTGGGVLYVASADATLGRISGGWFKNTYTGTSGYAVNYTSSAGGTVITGGVFDGVSKAINGSSASTPIVLEGGYFSHNTTNSEAQFTGTLGASKVSLPSGYGGISTDATYYTLAPADCYVSSNGSDTTGDGTQEKPFATLNKALEEVAEGGTVHVMDPVTVSEQVGISKDVTITGKYSDADGEQHSDGQLLRGAGSVGDIGLAVSGGVTVTMKSLTYDGNGTAEDCQKADAAISVLDGSTLNLDDVVIQNHHCWGIQSNNQDKGVIHVAANGALHMTGGALRNNTETQSNWGIISVLSNGQATLTDVTVEGNTQTVSGPILKADDTGASLTLAGSTAITDNTAPNGAVWADTLNLSGTPVIRDNHTSDGVVRNVYRDTAGRTISVTGTLAAGSAVGVTDDNAAVGTAFATASSEEIASASASAFSDDTGAYAVAASGTAFQWKVDNRAVYVSSGGNDDTGNGTQDTPYATLTKALAMVADGGTVHVMDAVTVSTDATISKNVTITGAYTDADGNVRSEGRLLRGYAGSGAEGGLITVSDGITATMANLIYDGNGGTYRDARAALTVLGGATLNLNDVVLQNHNCKGGLNSNLDKGVIHVAENGTLHMTGGALQNNTEAMTSWGIISGMANSRVTLTDVTVTGNKQTASGPILMATYAGASLTLAGSTTITGNQAPNGAVYAAALNLSGTPVIRDNTTNGSAVRNVYRDNADKTITVTGALEDGSAVGVTDLSAAMGVAFATASSEEIASASAGYFFHDGGTYAAAADGKDLVWTGRNDYYVSTNGSDSNLGTREKPYQTLQKALTMVADGGTVYVMDDVTTAGFNAGFAKSVTITTDPDSVTESFSTATVSLSSSLMTVNGADQTVTLENITLTANATTWKTPMVTVTSGELVMNSGATVTGYSGTYAPVYINGADGSVELNEGASITGNNNTATSGNNVDSSYGGGVYVKGGAMTINGGAISGNTGYLGGGVYVDTDGTLTMEGGSISDNTVSGNSGGVALNTGGTFNMNGGTISGNSGNSGGGVLINGTMTMAGGTIYGNTTGNYGGGVCVSNGTLTMTDGEISGNTASVNGGGVYMNSASLNLSGDASITGNTLTDDTASNIYRSANSTINVTNTLTGTVGVTDASAGNGVTFATATDTDMAAASAEHFFHDGDAYQVSVSGTSLQWKADTSAVYVSAGGSDSGDGTRAKPYLTLKQALTNVADGGTIYVMNDVKTAGYGSSNYAKNVTITTDPKALTKDEAGNVTAGIATATLTGALAIPYAGNTITLENITFDGTGCPTGSAIFYIGTANGNNSGKLHLKSGTTIQNFTGYWGPVFTGPNANNTVTVESGARIINNTNNGPTTIGYSSGYGGGITMNGGTLTMNGGEISGNTAPYGGGGVYLASSVKMVMNGGTISGNSAGNNNGGGIYANANALTMNGGTITGNTARSGGGVYVYSGTMTMSGGEIRGNTAATAGTAYYGGGVYINSSCALSLSGAATVTGNTLTDGTTANVYRAAATSTITVTDTLTGAVGVTDALAANGGAFATASSEEIASASAEHFSDDTGVYLVGANGTNLVWEGQSEYYVASSAGGFNGSDSNPGTREKPFATLTKALNMVADGGTIYVMDDITEARSNISNARNVTITTDPQSKEDGAAVVTMTGTTSVVIQTSGTTLTLENIVFDGNGTGSNAPFILGASDNSGDSGKLVLESGAVIRNFSTIFGAVWTNTNANNAITIKAGASITGNKNTYNKSGSSYNSGYGGGITLRGGTLTIEGGEISNNTSSNYGGGVYLASSGATMTMSGGAISGNAGTYGGGVYSNGGSVTMTGGEIRDNTATTGYGGGVQMGSGTLTMSGGKISGNTAATYGGGVYLASGTTMTMEGGEISGNTATKNDGGGVYVYGSMTMTGGTITGNTAGANGGGVCTYNTGTLNMDGGTITGNTAATQGGGVYVVNYNGAALNLSGDASITGNTCGTTANNVYKAGSGVIKVTGNLTGSVGVTYGGAGNTFATANTAEIATASAAHFLHDAGTCKAVAESTSLKWALRTAIQLDAPTLKGLDYTSVTIEVKAGQTYILRTTATGEALQTFEAPGDGTHTFQDLTAGTAYYIYTTLPGQGPNDDPYYTDSANTVVRTRAPAGTELIQDGSFEKQNADKVWLGLNVDSAVANPEIGVGKTSYGLTAADGSYVCELNGTSNTYPEAVYQKVSVYPGATINVTASVAKRASYNGTMQIGVMPATESPVWSDFTAAALTPTVTSGSAAVSGTVITPVSGWSRVQCTYTVPEGVYEVYVIFQALTPTSGAGNLIDKISVKEAAEYYVSSTGSDTDGIGTRENPYQTLAKAVSTLPEEGGTIHVMDTVTQTATVSIGKNVTITGKYTDADGNIRTEGKLLRGSALNNSHLLTVTGGNVTLADITLDGNNVTPATLSGDTGNTNALLSITGGTVTLDSGAILQNNNGGRDYSASTAGAAVVAGGALVMNEGAEIKNCSVGRYGGAVTLGKSTSATGTFTMNGGSITGNSVNNDLTTAAGYGGTVYIWYGTFTMNGGTITGNTVTNGYGAGVYQDANATVNLSGSATITGNTADGVDSNVYLESSKTITVTGDLTGPVGVTQSGAANGGTFATASSADIANASVGAFVDDTGAFVAVADSTSLKWAGVVASVTKADGTVTEYGSLQAAVNAAGEGDTVTLLADTSETVAIATSFDTLEWGGKTLTGVLTINSGAAVNTIQNTVDGQQNYTTGGISGAANTVFKINGTVGEIKGGYYRLNASYEAVAVSSTGKIERISGGWFYGNKMGICWMGGGNGGTVITGGVLQGNTTAMGAFDGTLTNPIVLEGGYYSSNTFIFTSCSTLDYTGTLAATTTTLPEGYGGISTTTTYYTLAQTDFYVKSTGSDETGDGTRENPYQTVNAALAKLSGITGTVYIMDSVDFGSSNSFYITSNVTIKGDPQRSEDVEARVTATTTSAAGHLMEIRSNGTLTVEDVTFDGNGTQRGFVWLQSNGTNMTLNLNAGAVVTNFNDSDRSYGGIICVGYGSSSGSGIINLNGGQVTGNNVNTSLGAIVLYNIGTLNISGDSTVTGNVNSAGEDRNIYISTTTQLKLSGDFTGAAGVYQSGAVAGGQFGTMASTSYTGAGNFTCDSNPALSSTANGSNLVWAANRDDVYVSLNGSDTSGDGTELKPYKTLLYAYGKVNAGGTIHVMTANVPTAVASGYVNALGKYIAVNKSVTISGEGYDGASVKHNNGNAPILMASNSNYTTTFKNVGVTSAGSTLLRYGNADNALIDIRNGVVTMENVTVSGHYNNGTANGRSSIDWSDGTIRVAGGTLNLTDTTVTGNTTNGAVYKIGGTVNLSGATSITNNTKKGTGGANLYLKTASQSVNVADDFAGAVGVTQAGAAVGVTLAVATGETQAQAKTGMFTDDANTGFDVRTDGANLVWGKDIVTYVPDKYRIVVISDNADETFTITKNGVTIEGTKVYDEELGQYITTFEGLDPSTTYPVVSSKGTTQNVKTLNITALEKAIRSASPFTVYEGETVSLATVLGSKVAHLSGCVSLTDMSVSDTSYATVSGSGRTAKITGVQVTGDQQIDLTLTASTRGCGVYGTCNTGEITIQIIVVPQVVIRTTVADRTSIVVGDCSTKLQYALYDASGNLVSDWVSPTDDGEGGLYVRFDSLTESTNYTVKARYGDGDNDYGTATKAVKTTATSALQKAIESASPFTIYEGETVTLASVLGSKVYHLSGCVSLTNMVVTDTGIATVSDPGRSAKITGVKLGSTDITMTASTNGCYYYGTTTANGVKITVNVIPKVEIKSVSTTAESITVSNCDTRFQYALYDADGNPVGDTEWLSPNDDGTVTWDGLTDKTNYTVMVRYGDGNNSYGTASKTVTTGQIYNGTVEELYSFSQGTGVTAGFKVNMAENPGTGYTLRVTDANGNSTGTAALQGGWYGGNYVVKVTNLTAGTTYTVQAVVGGNAVGEALEWTAPAETYSSHNSTGNTSGYWSSSDVSTKTDGSGATQVVSGIAYNVKSNGMSVDIQGYGKTKTTYANAGWTVKVSGGSNLWVWAEPTIVKGESGADYVVLTYHIRNNSASSLSNVWLGANADIMIGSNDRAPVYMEGYGIRTAVNEADDALSFAIITQHGGGVAEYADSVTTRWFGYYGYRNNYTFSNTNSTSLTGTDSGAAFSWKVGALAAGETREYSVVIGVAGKEDQNQDITNPAPFTETEAGPEETVTQTQLAAPTVTETTSESVTINVVAGQTYILRLDADGESYMEFEATEDGTYTFEGLAPSSTYYIYTKLTEQDADANPFYTESANATAATKATVPGQPKGDFILNAPTDWNENDLTYQFGNAEATLTNVENFKNLSVMVDTGSFTLTQEALTALGSYGSVAGVSASGSYVRTAAAGSKYTYLIFSGTFTKTQAENFLRALTFNAEGYGVYQQVDVDADVIDLPSGVARLGSSYYRYVAYRGITWSNAYKAAKASSFNGLPGYLITVDSSVEHNFVYQTYGSVNGWMGGLRTTATSGFDGATYNTSNPGTSGAWKWVCGPNAGDPFWNGWNSSSSNRIPGVYANWNSGEPNNASGEWAAQYGFGSGGRWNDYKPTNSAIGGYFIEYTAYGSYSAADPMAHDDQTNVFGAPVAVIWVNGVKGTKTYSTLAKALEDYTDSTNQVIQMIANTEEDSVTIGQDVYLDLNGHEVKADITVSEGFTLYGLDTTTDGYKDLEKYGQITGTVTGQVGSITKTTKSHFAKAKNYLPVSNGDSSLEFHRFNTVVYKYTGKIDNEADTAMLNYTLGFQGDSTVVGQLEAIGAGARISGSDTYTYGWNYDLSAVPGPSNPYLYDTNLVNLSTTGMVNGYTTYYDLVGALKFGGVQVDSESVKRSFLQVLKLYYKRTNTQEQEEIMTFITKHNLNTEWEALG